MQHKGLARLLSRVLDEIRQNGFKEAYVRFMDCLDGRHEQAAFRLFERFGFARRDSAPDRNIFLRSYLQRNLIYERLKKDKRIH